MPCHPAFGARFAFHPNSNRRISDAQVQVLAQTGCYSYSSRHDSTATRGKVCLNNGISFFRDRGSQGRTQWCCGGVHTDSKPAVLREHGCTSRPPPGGLYISCLGSPATDGFTSG